MTPEQEKLEQQMLADAHQAMVSEPLGESA